MSTKTTQGELHVLRRRLTMHKQGVLRAEEELAHRVNTVKDIEARIKELEYKTEFLPELAASGLTDEEIRGVLPHLSAQQVATLRRDLEAVESGE